MATLNFPLQQYPGGSYNESSNINSSLQVGGTLYYTATTVHGVAQHSPLAFGIVDEIKKNLGDIEYTPFSSQQPAAGDFILFSQDSSVNESSLKGYFADVTFTNNSNKMAELFAVSSEIALSSK